MQGNAKKVITLLFFILLLLSQAAAQGKKTPKPIAPYSAFVWAGNTLYLAGQIPIDPNTGKLIRDDIQKATRQVMDNIGAILKQNELNFNNLVKCTIYLKDMNNYSEVNKVYAEYFPGKFPARVAVEVARLPLDADIEISSIAVK